MCSHAHLNIQQSNDPLTQLVKSKHFQMKLQRSKTKNDYKDLLPMNEHKANGL